MAVPNPYCFVLDARAKFVGARRKRNSQNILDGVLVVLQVLRFHCHRTMSASIWWMVPDRREAVHVPQFSGVSIEALGHHAAGGNHLGQSTIALVKNHHQLVRRYGYSSGKSFREEVADFGFAETRTGDHCLCLLA
ncbi:uncharacterized protein LOC127798512 isoform X2 [Diospyros lotus]|uniref:uncharacterized protein LOC127798512 isoform X2 n=1 Tax=Diospyros lotus TaxID=55363 RepID=UPI002256A5C7|nr:uncharacterized protein LOC127798512 isoform X2 [Diospyros lotus]